MRRRQFIALLGVVTIAGPPSARAQQADRVRMVGILQGLAASDPEWSPRFAGFTQGLKDLGWSEERNLTFEKRFADAKPERLPMLAAELARANVDVIVTSAAQPIEAARKATSSIPIVMASVGDALGAGYVASLAHPGGNITGLTLVATDMGTKRLQLIREVVPKLSRIAVIWNADASGHRLQMKEMNDAASALAIAIQSLPVRTLDEIETSLQSAIQSKAEAIVTMDDPLVQSARGRIAEVATQRRIPFMSEFKAGPVAGGLISYGPSQVEMWTRAAFYVDKIFRGMKAADLPVEQPTKFELVVNLKTAKAIGLTIPESFLTRVDEVIE
jgi:putative ABC transport system substrate-binding protein